MIRTNRFMRIFQYQFAMPLQHLTKPFSSRELREWGCGLHSRNSRHSRLRIVPVNEVADASENGPLFAPAAADPGSGGDNAAGKPAEREGLEPNAAGATKGCEEQTFTAEKRGLDFANKLDVVVDCWLESNNAAGIDTQQFARVLKAAGVEPE